MPEQEPVVWPDDPVEGEAPAEEAEPAKAVEPSWPASFEEALHESVAKQEPAAAAPENESPTQPSMPAIQAMPAVPDKSDPVPAGAEVGKTAPPEPSKRNEPVSMLGTADEMPTSTFKTPLPASPSASASNGGEPRPTETAAAAPQEDEVIAEPAAEPVAQADAPKVAETEAPAEPPVAPPGEPPPEPSREPEPVPQPVEAPAPEPKPEPVQAEAPPPAPEPEWTPMPVNPSIPSWAPSFTPAAPVAEVKVDWPGSNLPSWAPIGGGRSTSNMPAATRISSTPAPAQPGQPAPAPAPAPAPSASQPAAPAAPSSQPAAAQPGKQKSSSWEIVPPKVDQAKGAYMGPSAEDKSYAEWFAWAKRSGAPATACHAAAQGAFRALAAGHDMNTAVQWATLAMASPPGLVSASRQLYCAWYSLGNIDLKLPSPQAHAFAAGAIAALEGGADAPTAHQAGLTAAGIMG